MQFSYLKDPEKIYAESFERIRGEAELERFNASQAEMVVRIIHACGMPDIADDIIATPDIMECTVKALQGGAPILCDSTMVAAGITKAFLPANNRVVVTLGSPDIAALARKFGTTRSAAAVDHWRDDIAGSVVALGNAPTALFHLLERLAEGWARPAAILAFPVGFVGAAESKAALAESYQGEFITVKGRRGGSALASAAVNAAAIRAGQ